MRNIRAAPTRSAAWSREGETGDIEVQGDSPFMSTFSESREKCDKPWDFLGLLFLGTFPGKLANFMIYYLISMYVCIYIYVHSDPQKRQTRHNLPGKFGRMVFCIHHTATTTLHSACQQCEHRVWGLHDECCWTCNGMEWNEREWKGMNIYYIYNILH